MLWMSVGYLPCLDVRCKLVCVSLEKYIRKPYDRIRIWNTMSGGRLTGGVEWGGVPNTFPSLYLNSGDMPW